jgi:hydrogenase maturation protease
MKRILVAGIGNIFHGDDAFGCKVVRDWSIEGLKHDVSVKDFGISSYDLAHALTSGYDTVILVDAVARGGEPGTVYLTEPGAARGHTASAQAHSIDVESVIRMTRAMGRVTAKMFLVGCEPAVLEDENGTFELSEKVRAAVGPAREMIESLVNDIFDPTLATRASTRAA